MGKEASLVLQRPTGRHELWSRLVYAVGITTLFGGFVKLSHGRTDRDAAKAVEPIINEQILAGSSGPYGEFPVAGDPLQLIPCTPSTVLPALNDTNPQATWAALFDPDPSHWSWQSLPKEDNSTSREPDNYAGRAIYLCGYLDVPLDYTNASDPRIARIAVNKYQVSGLAPKGSPEALKAGHKSDRTIVVNPGGPGGSGIAYAWNGAEGITKRLSDSKYDVLGFDPRGVNSSLPSIACYPHNANRDRWAPLTGQAYEVVDPRQQLELMDAMNDATFRACWEQHGDAGRFMTTAFVARDLNEIRKALGEAELTGHFVSYGTGLAQTYTSMFPQHVGRMSLDGTEYVRDHRELGGFGWTALDNGTDAWNDGFLGECINAGPDKCSLAKPVNNETEVTLSSLKIRTNKLLASLMKRPLPAYSPRNGPSLITYSWFIDVAYGAMYRPRIWPQLARVVAELEQGNTTSAAKLSNAEWSYDPSEPCRPATKPTTAELYLMVVCGDSWDAPQPKDGLDWWESLWQNMTTKSWIAGNDRFFGVFPCRNFAKYWPTVAEAYRGDLNKTLSHPVLLLAETYDPATPLRNGRRLLNEMGDNARLVVHHGYGHSSADKSNCTDAILKSYFLNGTLPEEKETPCYANEKPYLYKDDEKKKENKTADDANYSVEEGNYGESLEMNEEWREHVAEMRMLDPHLPALGQY